jgi:hypothetical protein
MKLQNTNFAVITHLYRNQSVHGLMSRGPHITRPATLIEFAVVTKNSGGALGTTDGTHTGLQGTVLRRFLQRIKIAFC